MTEDKYLFVMPNLLENVVFEKNEEEKSTYRFKGTFTVFDVKNNNNRIYEANNFLPFLKKLQDKIKEGTLLGELDHPKDFEVRNQRASHKIEELTYNKEKNLVEGKIVLLNTRHGKDAAAIADAGVPLHVSSRASGSVNESGKVRLDNLITYDLVSDPGFSQARLNRIDESLSVNSNVKNILESNYQESQEVSSPNLELVNESLGLDNNILIYKYKNKQTKEEPKMTSDFVKKEELVEWSKKFSSEFNRILEIKDKEINDLKSIIESKKESNLNKDVEDLSEKLESVIGWVNRIAEDGRKLGEYTSKISESGSILEERHNKTTEDSKKIIEWIDEQTPKLNALWEHAEDVTEKSEALYQLVEKHGEGSRFLTDYIKELTEKSEALYQLVEKHGEGSRFLTDYIKEVVEKNQVVAEHVDELSETCNTLFGSKVNENKPFNSSNIILESNEKEGKNYQDAISSKLDSLINSVNESREKLDYTHNKELHFLSFLSLDKKKEFASLDTEVKSSIVESMKSNKWFDENDILAIWENTISGAEKIKGYPVFVKNAPKEYIGKWETLNENVKLELEKQAQMWDVSTPDKIKHFWETRNINNIINETKTQEAKVSNVDDINEENLLNEIKALNNR